LKLANVTFLTIVTGNIGLLLDGGLILQQSGWKC